MARKTKTRTRRASSRRPQTRKTRTRRASNGGNVWTRQDIAFLRKHYRKFPTAWIARQLGRTVYSVRYKASDLNIKKANPSVWKANSPSARPTKRRASARRSNKRYGTSRRRSPRRTASRRTTRRRRR